MKIEKIDCDESLKADKLFEVIFVKIMDHRDSFKNMKRSKFSDAAEINLHKHMFREYLNTKYKSSIRHNNISQFYTEDNLLIYIDEYENKEAEREYNNHSRWNKKITDKPNDRPTLAAIALLYVYQGTQITMANHNEIANKYGYKSGHKLYQHYNKYSYRSNRTGFDTDKKSKERLKLFDYVINLLKEFPQIQKNAIEDRRTLEAAIAGNA